MWFKRIIKTIGRFITGGGLDGVADKLKDAYLAKKQADTDQGRIAATVTIKQLEERQSILLMEQRTFITRMMRPAFAAPFIIYNFKVLVWDKVLGWGSTDPMSADFWKIAMLIITFYFLGRPFEKVMQKRVK